VFHICFTEIFVSLLIRLLLLQVPDHWHVCGSGHCMGLPVVVPVHQASAPVNPLRVSQSFCSVLSLLFLQVPDHWHVRGLGHCMGLPLVVPLVQ
jgi:hypothetical protein